MNENLKEKIAQDKKSVKPIIISEGTLIPLSMVISLFGVAAWITYVAYSTNANAQAIQEMKSRDSQVVKELRAMNTRLSRIEGKLDGLQKGR